MILRPWLLLTMSCLVYPQLLGQVNSPQPLKLPRAMGQLTPQLEGMVEKVNQAASKLGLRGWPDSYSYEEGREKPEPESATKSALKQMPLLIRQVWVNDRVLWVRLSPSTRWDAIVIMQQASSKDDSSPRKMVWIKDAFGSCSLTQVLPTDGWSEGDVLCWEGSERSSFRYLELPSNFKVQQEWALTLDGKRCEFSCAPPESDAGLRLAFHRKLGVAFQVDEVDPLEDGDGSMALVLKPNQFKGAVRLFKGQGRVWFRCPDVPGGVEPILCVTKINLFAEWVMKYRTTH